RPPPPLRRRSAPPPGLGRPVDAFLFRPRPLPDAVAPGGARPLRARPRRPHPHAGGAETADPRKPGLPPRQRKKLFRPDGPLPAHAVSVRVRRGVKMMRRTVKRGRFGYPILGGSFSFPSSIPRRPAMKHVVTN